MEGVRETECVAAAAAVQAVSMVVEGAVVVMGWVAEEEGRMAVVATVEGKREAMMAEVDLGAEDWEVEGMWVVEA